MRVDTFASECPLFNFASPAARRRAAQWGEVAMATRVGIVRFFGMIAARLIMNSAALKAEYLKQRRAIIRLSLVTIGAMRTVETNK